MVMVKRRISKAKKIRQTAHKAVALKEAYINAHNKICEILYGKNNMGTNKNMVFSSRVVKSINQTIRTMQKKTVDSISHVINKADNYNN